MRVRNRKSRLIAIVTAFIMAITIYGGTSAMMGNNVSHAATDDGVLKIKSVEVLQEPELQSNYRATLYKGDAAEGEDPDKWYTTRRAINLKDPRLFTFEFTASADTVGADPDAFLDTVDLQYGGYALDEWANTPGATRDRNTLRKDETSDVPYLVMQEKNIAKEGDDYTVTVTMETKCPWASSRAGTNIPFDGYYAGRQLYEFSSGQSSDNRWWWQTTPTHKGLGEYAMTAVAGEDVLASTNMHIVQYDDANSWIEKNEFAQSLVKAITGSEVSKAAISDQVTGTVASGYLATDESGNFVSSAKGTGVWVEVSILGYGLTDNDKEENQSYNNYARFNPIWNIVVAKDADKVDTYLNETKPTMNSDPDSLINEYKDANAEDIDMINVFYQNNVHSDEITGIDTEIQLIKDLIDGGYAGKEIGYYTWTEDDMDFRYRDPAEGFTESTTGHVVKGGYTGRFIEKNTRNNKIFKTAEALDKLIFVTNITANPDGQAGMRRTNRYAFDLNRDAVFATMPETRALIKDLMKWDPLVMNEWHGYVQNMLIEPCTAPHDPAYDYDLMANNMRNLTYAAGMAVTANTAYNNFLVPWDHYNGGAWDDGGTIYGPMFAILLGSFSYTIEFPHANSDSYDAGNVINYAMVDELLHGTVDIYKGNRLNGPLEDVNGIMRDSHYNDYIDESMRKNTILSKLEVKKRGIENVDSMDADKYFIDKINGEDKVVGRSRPVDENGNELSFFPDYIVIPEGDLQYNIAEGIKIINQMIDWGVEVQKTTEAVEYDGKTIPKNSYVISMNQAHRNVIFETMSKGYDATGFADMYADIYCNLPDVRGFDSIQVYGKGLFDGKTKAQTDNIQKRAEISGSLDEYVCFKSQSTDAVRFVNYLLDGDKADVYMLRKDIQGVGEASDYLVATRDFNKLSKMKDNPVIGKVGAHIVGTYTDSIPEEAVPLVEPVIQFNTARTAQSGGPLWYLLDDYLGFGSLSDYNGGSALRDGANVIIANNVNANSFQNSWVDAVKSGQAGLIMIRNAAGLGKLGTTAPKSSSTFQDVAVNGDYNVDDSLYSNNYEPTHTYYARGYSYSDLPEKSKVLFKSYENGEDAFIGGFQPTEKDKTVFGDKVTMFSTMLDGEDFERPVSVPVYGQQMDYRSHYQKLLPMLATSIFAGAAGIIDDMVDPTVEEMTREDNRFTVSAVDDEKGSGVGCLEIYKVKDDQETLIMQTEEDTYSFTNDEDQNATIKVVAYDKAGNASERYFTYDGENGDISSDSNPEEVADAKDAALATLQALQEEIEASSMSDEEKAAAQEEVAAAMDAIEQAHTTTQVAEALANTTTAVNEKISNAENAKEAKLADAKLAAINELTMTAGGTEGATAALTAAIANIQQATSVDEVATAKAAGIESVEKAKQEAEAAKLVKPGKVTIKKAKRGKKKVTVTWKKLPANVTGYEIQVRDKKGMTKTVTAKSTQSSKVIKKLKKGKYTVRVRAYNAKNGQYVYGSWSKAKKVKIK